MSADSSRRHNLACCRNERGVGKRVGIDEDASLLDRGIR